MLQLPSVDRSQGLSSVGNAERIDLCREPGVVDFPGSAIRNNGFRIVAVEQAENSTMLNDFYPEKNEKYALVFGNEVNGVSEEVMKNLDGCIEIPQFGTKHSFNIVISAGIVLWDFFSKMVGSS